MPKDKSQKGHRGPYSVLTPEEVKAILMILNNHVLTGTLASAHEKLSATQNSLYNNMRKPL